MPISNASAGHHNYPVGYRPSRRWVGAFAAVVACLSMAIRYARSDDTEGEPKPGTVITNSISMKLAYIPPGEFLMGSPDSDDQADDYEKPQHRVRISKPFYLGVHEVTQKEWEDVMGTAPWKGRKRVREGNDYAASYVSWQDANAFCRKLTDKENKRSRLNPGESYRLPTEAEWEYACRARSTTRFYFGNDLKSFGKYAWYIENAVKAREHYAHTVGQKRPNAWGLFDMYGNVAEWCSDWFGEKYYGESPFADPQGPPDGTGRLARGGGCFYVASLCRSAARVGFNPGKSGLDRDIGFRVVRTIAPSE